MAPQCSQFILLGPYRVRPCASPGAVEERGRWWCRRHAPGAARKRRETQRAEAVRIVQAWGAWLDGGGFSPAEFASYLYPDPEEVE